MSLIAAARRRARQIRRNPGRWTGGAVLLGVLVFLVVRGGDLERFHAWMRSVPAPGVAGLVFALPLAGFPVSALHLAAGLRFEFWPALLLVATATLAQHAAAWALVRALPAAWFARLAPWRERLAGAGHAEAAVLCALVPGMPYSVQLYLLPAMGAPLRVLARVSVPLHTARASVTILLGTLSADFTPARGVALAAYYAAVFTVCGFALRRLRRRLAGRAARRAETVSPVPGSGGGTMERGARPR